MNKFTIIFGLIVVVVFVFFMTAHPSVKTGSEQLSDLNPKLTFVATNAPVVVNRAAQPAPIFVKTKGTSNIRSGPGDNFKLLATVDRGVEVELVCYDDSSRTKWYQLTSGGWIWYTQLESQPDYLRNCLSSTSPETLISMPVRQPTLVTPVPTEPPTCRGGCTTYPDWCASPIKGNISYDSGERIYHVQGQEYYDETTIRPEYGERWFCTEDEARAAGWRKARSLPSN